MKWVTYLKGAIECITSAPARPDEALVAVDTCMKCPFKQIHKAADGDFLDLVAAKALGVDAYILTCGTPGKPTEQTCGCWLGSLEFQDAAAYTVLTLNGKSLSANVLPLCKTAHVGSCPQEKWENVGSAGESS